MKGLSLPINALIIIAVAVIVMLSLIAMFYPSFFSGSMVVSVESVKSDACKSLKVGNSCNLATNLIITPSFDADKDGRTVQSGTENGGTTWNGWGTGCYCNASAVSNQCGDTLASMCYCYYQIRDEVNCTKLCGC